MTTSLRSTMQVQLGWTWRDSTGGHAVVNSNRLHAGVELEGGAGVGEADAVWDAVNQSLSAGSSMVLSLDALARPLFGDTITVALSRVKAILIVNRNTSGSGYLVLGDAGENAWHAPLGAPGHTVKIMPGAALLLACPRDGWEVSAGSAELKLTAVADDASFDAAIVGVAAG